jgi:hypothetical protein
MTRERRAYPRAKIKWAVTVKTDKGTMDGVTSDVTPNGVFIHCQKPLRLNVVFEMAMSNRWGPDDEITPRGMGVRFVKISSEARKFVARAAMNNLKSKEVAPELLQTLETLVIEIDKAKSRAA